MYDGETIVRGIRKNVVFLSAHQVAHYGGYVPAVRSLQAVVYPPSSIEDFWQDLQHLPCVHEVGHA